MTKRNYRKEYDSFHGTQKQISLRQKRNKARNGYVKKGLAHKGDGQEVDHIDPLSKGGSNSSSNTRVVSRDTNRSRRYGKKSGQA